MQDRFSALLPILGAIVAFLIAALLVLYIIRLLFGRGIRSAAKKGSRRLDVVDVFDLDRERQLVIVRRDNTEHLLLIGGPNDLLVEGAISPVDAAAARPAREMRPLPPPATAGWPAEPAAEPAATAAPARSGGPPNLPPDLFAPASKGPPKPAAPEPTPAPAAASAPPPPAPAPSAPPPAPPRPAAPPPPARPAPPRAATPPFLARTQRVLQPKPDAGPTPPPPAPPAAPRPAAPPAPPASGSQASPSSPAAPNRPAAPPPAPPPSAPPPSAPIVDVDPLESLEAEMARLLGRPDKE